MYIAEESWKVYWGSYSSYHVVCDQEEYSCSDYGTYLGKAENITI